MKLKHKATLLAAAIALAGATYLPSASASTTTNVTVDDSISYSTVIPALGTFTDWYDFSVNGAFSLVATANSLTALGISKGTELTAFNLYEGNHTNLIATGTVSSFALGSGNYYFGLLTQSPLLANFTYSLQTQGIVHSLKANNFSASLSTIAAVPLPGAVWMMLTGMVGLFGYQARNKKTA
jgi:hypothetical protein